MDDKTVVFNAFRMNYDGKLDMSSLASQVTVYDSTETGQIVERAAGHTVLVTKEMPMTGDVITALPDSVKLLCEAGTGYNNIDLAACRAKRITVCNIPAYSTHRVAHTAIMLLLNLSSSMQRQQAMLTRGNRSNFTEYLKTPHVEVNGKSLGIIGMGNIGREVAKLGMALGMDILVYTRTSRADGEGLRYVSLEQLLKNSDYISLHCPLNEKTRHLIDQKALALMKPGAFLINTARGALIDEQALIDALRNGVIAGAGLDVQENEPPVDDSPLYTMEQVVLTPHMGWKGLETRQRLVSILRDNIAAFSAGKPINVVS